MDFRPWISHAAELFELVGVGVMVLGALIAPLATWWRYRRRWSRAAYRSLRSNLGAAILLGLELLVAADIIRTVAEEPSFRSVAVLGLIVLIRTFLSFTLEVELEGRWPWQPERPARSELKREGAAPVELPPVALPAAPLRREPPAPEHHA